MPTAKRVVSALLLICGVVLVFTGLSTALGFTVFGVLASIAAITALLYAGAVWFGGTPVVPVPAGAESIIVFDRSLRVASGREPGLSILLQFPERLRPEIEMRCRAALLGEHSHFECEHAGARISFVVAPVQVNEIVLYGALISGAGVPVARMSVAPLTTVA
jgi:hypothetical protein